MANARKMVDIFIDTLPEEKQRKIEAFEKALNDVAGVPDNVKKEIRNMTDENLSLFVPNIYQRRIFGIDYDLLWDKGIRLISYDIDDTILPFWKRIPKGDPHIPKTKDLFAELKSKGFTIVLLSNASKHRTETVCTLVGADGYFAKAKKPDTAYLKEMLEKYGEGLDKSQVLHVGNNMCKDIFCGNDFGINTCLVRDMAVVGNVLKVKKAILSSVGHEIREEMRDRNMWRKHHSVTAGDQYYQLGEKQKCMKNFPW